jgi:repressor LexA
MKLTARQQQVLNLIASTIEEQGMPPTRAEIADRLGFKSPNAAEEHLKALARKGAIEMIPGASRGIRVVHHEAPAGLPVVGKVAAGMPILAQENIDQHINIPATLFHPAADFLLEVQGDSMKNAGILNGDFIAVRRTEQATNSQIVVARVNDEVTVKRFREDGHRVTLIPENEDYFPIVVDLRENNFAIEGIFVGVIRTSSRY